MSWHLEKSAEHDHDGAWLVVVDDELVGFVRPTCLRGRTRRRYQGFLGDRRVGRPCRTRKEAALRVLEACDRPTGTDVAE